MREAFFRADFLLEPLFVIQYVRFFKFFWGSANVLLQVSLKMGKNEKNFESNLYFEAQKYYFVFELRLNFFFKWSYSQRCENRRWKWQRCFDVVLRCSIQRWKTQRCFKLFYVVKFNVDVHNVVLTLIWRCAMSRRHINLKSNTLNRRWNVCWEYSLPIIF